MMATLTAEDDGGTRATLSKDPEETAKSDDNTLKDREDGESPEKVLFIKAAEGNVWEVLRLLEAEDDGAADRDSGGGGGGKAGRRQRVNAEDEHGMSVLQHAAYRGHEELCKALLERGADVNGGRHQHAYSTLTFAALSGNASLVATLLHAGADPTSVNSVGRTAAQMAAFVGNHACVSVINNFVPFADVEYFTKIQGSLETEPRLPPPLATPLHRLVVRPHVHPVGVLLHCSSSSSRQLLRHAPLVARVLSLMCEREMRGAEPDEVRALKLHVQGCVFRACSDASAHQKNEEGQKKEEKEGGAADVPHHWEKLVRHWLKGRKEDGFQENLERFVRHSIRDFPFPVRSSIVQQMARHLATVKVGGEPTALSLLMGAVCGQRMVASSEQEEEEGGARGQCATCGAFEAPKKCSACKALRYCGKECQKLHWFEHKKHCRRPSPPPPPPHHKENETGEEPQKGEGEIKEEEGRSLGEE